MSNTPDTQSLLTHDDRSRFCREVLQLSPDPVFLIEVTEGGRLCLKELNPAAERALGLPGYALLGMDLDEIAAGRPGPDTDASMRQVIDQCRRCIEGRDPLDFEGSLNLAPGVERRDYEVRLIPIPEAGRINRIIAIGHDVTERKRAEELLRQREAEFRTLAENMPDNLVRYDRECRVTYSNPQHARAIGVPASALLGTSITQPVSPTVAGMEEYAKTLQRVLVTGAPSETELIVSLPGQQPEIHHLLTVPERDGDGRVVGALSIGRDITERKRAEASLRMAASVFDTALEGITITDPSGVILDVNKAFTRITGYSRDAAIGKKPNMLRSGHHGREFYAAMWTALRNSGTWSGEIVNRHFDGEVFTEYLSISAVRDGNGAVVHFVGIFSDISRSKQHEARLEHLAHHDTLTGLPNRVLLADRLGQAIAQSVRSGKILAVFFLDLDGFKPINDTHGHGVGDRTLIELGKRMAKTLRASDTVARVGGDEFVMLLPGLSSAEECEASASRLLAAIAKPIQVDGHELSLTASIGIARHPRDAEDADTLLRCADKAMYAAKQTGRNRFVLWAAKKGKSPGG